MAEVQRGKRPNQTAPSSKVAAASPTAGPQGLVSLQQAVNAAIGSRVVVQTNYQTLEGTVFTICPVTSLLALTVSTPNPTYHVIPLSSLLSFNILSPPNAAPPALPPINTGLLQKRAADALARAKEHKARFNPEVNREAQDLFMALAKQFPGTQWVGRDMQVMGEVLIKAPGYRSEDCQAQSKEGAGALGRVKKVLENVRSKYLSQITTRAEKPEIAQQRDQVMPRESKAVRPVVPAIPAIPPYQGVRKGG